MFSVIHLYTILAIALLLLQISPLLPHGVASCPLLFHDNSVTELFGTPYSLRPLEFPWNSETLISQLGVSSIPLVKPRCLTKLEQSQFTLSEDLKSILVGLFLGDLCGQKQVVNTRLVFKQGMIHEDYLLHLFEIFKTYCRSGPKEYNLSAHPKTGKVYSAITFTTFSLPCFNGLYDLFYPGGKKVVPLNIGDLLTPLSLAYWICDDGSFSKEYRAITLYTNSFTWLEVNHLTNVLITKFGLNCTINKERDAFKIRISSKSLPVLQSLLKDIMPSMMLHKIGL